eukprot:209236_1
MKNLWSLLSTLFVWRILYVTCLGTTLTFQVEPREEQCFFSRLTRGEEFDLYFEVIRGGLLDIEFNFKAPTGQILEHRVAFFTDDENQNNMQGRFNHRANMEGDYAFCFDNRNSRWTGKLISFDLTEENEMMPNLQTTAMPDTAKVEDMAVMIGSVQDLQKTLAKISNLQKHNRWREAIHRDIQEATNGRVQWMAMLQFIALVGLSTFQLTYIKQWFSNTKKRGGV